MICSNATPGRFITFFYGVLETATRKLIYCNAGLNPPLVRKEDGTVLHLDQGGMVLGLFAIASYTQAEIELAPGDVTLLFTDGISEAMNDAEEELGEDRLVQIVTTYRRAGAKRIKQAVIDSVT
jgi:sigma-B regulation protein RsbU (phosphoserine phosphatase)